MLKKEANKYEANGWLLVKNLISSADADQLIASLCAEWPAWGAPGNRRQQAHFSHAVLLQILTSAPFSDYARMALTAEPILYWSSLFQFSSEMGAHVDREYIQTQPAGLSVGLWLSLDKIDKNNGGLWLASGSHLWNSEQRETCFKELTSVDQNEVPELQPGDLLVLHSNLIHGTCPVREKNIKRKSLVAHYLAKGTDLISEKNESESFVLSRSPGSDIDFLVFNPAALKNH